MILSFTHAYFYAGKTIHGTVWIWNLQRAADAEEIGRTICVSDYGENLNNK